MLCKLFRLHSWLCLEIKEEQYSLKQIKYYCETSFVVDLFKLLDSGKKTVEITRKLLVLFFKKQKISFRISA